MSALNLVQNESPYSKDKLVFCAGLKSWDPRPRRGLGIYYNDSGLTIDPGRQCLVSFRRKLFGQLGSPKNVSQVYAAPVSGRSLGLGFAFE